MFNLRGNNLLTNIFSTVCCTKNGSIILMHDTKKQTVTILEKLLKQLKEEGYQFVTVSELDKIKQIKKYEK